MKSVLKATPTLPKTTYLPMHRCNLPAHIVGSLTFQKHPTELKIDSAEELYKDIFERLKKLQNPVVRAKHFMHYLSAQFFLEHPEEMGLEENTRLDRSKATYLRLLRGWAFNSDSTEGAVLKGWVESRFGLIPRFHIHPIRNPNDDHYLNYIQEWANGVYNTNALENQLDLLYTFCQYELTKRFKGETHITLYRGFNQLKDYEVFHQNKHELVVLLNNINSFSSNQERADEFGDYIMEVSVPLSKIAFYNALLPKTLSGEDEFAVIGGLYAVRLI